jgi:amidase
MKATHGLVPSYGMSYMDHTLDHIGPITRTVADNALLLEIIAGEDWRDPQWVRGVPAVGDYQAAAGQGVRGLRIGVVAESLGPSNCTRGVLAAFEGAKTILGGLGAHLGTVSVPLWTDAQSIIAGVLQFALHAMDASGGQGYGHLGRIDVNALAVTVAQNRLGAKDLPAALVNGLVTVDYLKDAYLGLHFGKVQNLRLELRRQMEHALAGVDLLVTPTTACAAFELLNRRARPGEMANRVPIGGVINTAPLDLTGHPALTVPSGSAEDGLPVGLQIIGARFGEALLYRAGFAFEAAGP